MSRCVLGLDIVPRRNSKSFITEKNGSKPIKEGVMRTVHIIRNNKCLEFRAALQLDPLEV
jgi:hypothetical protein